MTYIVGRDIPKYTHATEALGITCLCQDTLRCAWMRPNPMQYIPQNEIDHAVMNTTIGQLSQGLTERA